ncbi:leucine zipper domain-containing protein [Micromonospora sp. WMMD1120]|nr:leucine zipper domain-containing protein [Micromonospora sp. WMMD1120]MDG4808194.1 leucine zipper domain-containing protein [Micromonospora sp. WMMD1120]
MAHRNARLTIHGRRLLVTRVVDQGRRLDFDLVSTTGIDTPASRET